MLPDETLETLVFLRKVAGAGDPGDEVALTSASSPGIGSNNPFNSLPGCSQPQGHQAAPHWFRWVLQRIVSGGANAAMPLPFLLPPPSLSGSGSPSSNFELLHWKCHLGLANVFNLIDHQATG